jgi:hypothetical protein
VSQPAGGLGFFERGDQISEGAVVDAATALGYSDGEADRQMCFADARRAEEDDVLFALEETEFVETVELLALDGPEWGSGGRGLMEAPPAGAASIHSVCVAPSALAHTASNPAVPRWSTSGHWAGSEALGVADRSPRGQSRASAAVAPPA